MPIYEFKCMNPHCLFIDEALLPRETPPLRKCPRCRTQMRFIMSVPAKVTAFPEDLKWNKPGM